jgi:hypothetical protein
MKKVLLIIFFLTFLLSFSHTNAQIEKPLDGVSISSFPKNPEPLEKVTVTLESYLVDINSALITWFSNGKNINHGIGMKEITVKAPSGGSNLTIIAILKTSEGREVQKSVAIKSGVVDLLFESINSEPPFFDGKNPFVYQNKIKLIAMPHLYTFDSRELDSKKLIYQWKMGGKFIDGASGYGKQSILINGGDIPKTLSITVEVYNREQTVAATGKIEMEPTDPFVIFYENNPLYGIYYNKEVSSKLNLYNPEITLVAYPFGFNLGKNLLTYVWSINNIEQPNLSKNQSITLKTRTDTGGSSNVGIDIKNVKNILQGTQSSLNINFKKKTVNDNVSIF